MARKPPSKTPSLPFREPTEAIPEGNSTQPQGISNDPQLQNDRAKSTQAIPDSQQSETQKDSASDSRKLRPRVESDTRSEDDSTPPREAGNRPEPGRERNVGIGNERLESQFTRRLDSGGEPTIDARRSYEVRPQSYTARIVKKVRSHSLFDPPDPEEIGQPDPPVTDETNSSAPSNPTLVPPSSITPANIASGEKAKARDILAAIRTLQSVEAEHRGASPEEKQILSRFAGFGPVALSIFPDPVTNRYKDATWQALGEELKSLLTPEEYDSAKRTTFNAFYTSPTVIKAIHEAISRLGVPKDATVLEPGCGTGNFMSYASQGMRFIGVELDGISGRIAMALHPGQDIRIENFRDTKLPEDCIEAVVGNVPFADLKLDYRGQKLSLHDYFFAKSIDALKPSGILALVTTHYTLDKQNAAIREYLAEKADFLGAIRLPSDAFKREGTAVVTDILFLRKRAPAIAAQHVDPEWLRVAPLTIEGAEIPINRYFLGRPEMVLGTWSRKDTLYGGDSAYSVIGNGDLAQQLQEAIRRLPEFAPFRESSIESKPTVYFTPPPPLAHISEGSFFVRDDRTICQIEGGQALPVTYGGTLLKSSGTMTGKRLAALIGLRDHARRVLQSQNEGWPEENRDQQRRELNAAYDRFSSNYGPINKTTFGETSDGTVIRRMPNLVKFREDPDAMLVMSLEDYDELTGRAAKASDDGEGCRWQYAGRHKVPSAEEGLLVSLNLRGTVDLPFISTLYNKPEEQIIIELGDLIFHDPESKSWQTADVYLSGNVREKLRIAERAGEAYARNVQTLQAVQPEDVLPGDIDANLGAPWVPETDIQAFATHLFKVDPTAIRIGHLKKDAVWSVEADYSAEQSVAATSEFGTPRANGTRLFEQALNMNTPIIYDTIHNGDREERVVNQESTLAAREKQKLIKERFRSWLFTDPERTERLVRLYNDTYNNLRPRLFDGSHLDYPGMNQTIRLRPHQNDAIWRGMSSGNTLLAHAVGAGKTFTMAATGMKMKQAASQKADVCGSQPHAGAICPRIHATLPQRQAARRHERRPQPRNAASI